jgi:hypothetical protein
MQNTRKELDRDKQASRQAGIKRSENKNKDKDKLYIKENTIS